MCTQPNVIEALREAEAALELAIKRILKRDPGHHVEVTSEAKALVSVRQALQCQGCDVPKDGVYQISEPSHSMSQYASKDDAERLRNLLCKMVDQLERRWKCRDGNAPGHGHSIPGVWDGDNGELAGQKCAWCEVWQEALEVRASAQAKQGGAA